MRIHVLLTSTNPGEPGEALGTSRVVKKLKAILIDRPRQGVATGVSSSPRYFEWMFPAQWTLLCFTSMDLVSRDLDVDATDITGDGLVCKTEGRYRKKLEVK